ncbi:gamma-glutamyl-gamma-aminobutyrate hydrolase family protein [Streptomyces sp. XM4193]|uniref:gamma-glutamyl-gamma-aminobutyrate hydrolase family protein n=1 Tax=Streptomyces sp. XM4193 TaxID=2929782 RepID=UPI001FFBB078|nr:gamma-glutamyl-gamma-aminobutyrate hydrolase family protein [Streptomyces sp. XM4193]MCK1797920.1 gamma-glutamyl-gamma-aminobutyrate hydrolase family protein [Streptomyces sp. XM4193]
MPTPLVGISTYLEPARWGVWDLPAALLPAGYHQLVQRSGGVAALLPPDENPHAAAHAVARLDALVVAGGSDIAPDRYGAEPGPHTGAAHPARDAWETALIEAALDARLPLLGICRGMQLLNVVCGGTLNQHLEGHGGPPGVFSSHLVTPVEGTRLSALLDGPLEVPTYHHQAVDRVGDSLTVSAYAQDGTVEALEMSVTRGFVLAVQWHPEAGEDLRVMRGLIDATR